ncbi:MAG: DUF6273 domain-containing protein [Roseburia sp.]|nr:DUF6273 domain-containing protein [Roseburia sp.]
MKKQQRNQTQRRKTLALLLTVALCMGILASGGLPVSKAVSTPDSETATADSDITLKNPTISDNGVTTWDCVWFGNYPQSDATGATKEPIKWRVLSVNGDDAFLLADQNLDCQKYNDTYMDDITWETCTMRSWLNGYGAASNKDGKDYSADNFLDKAFTASEQAAIRNTTVVNEDNPYYDTEGGNNTTDKVYLLSLSEVLNPSYGFHSDPDEYAESRRAKNTTYAKGQGVLTNPSGEYAGNGIWWLRSPGRDSDDASYVSNGGSVHECGGNVDHYGVAARPALHLNLSSTSSWSYAEKVNSEEISEISPTDTPTAVPTVVQTATPTVVSTANSNSISTSAPAPAVSSPSAAPSSSSEKAVTTEKEKSLKLSDLKCRKNSKVISGKVSVAKATVKIKVGKSTWKKAKVDGKKFTLKLSSKLKKKTKITIKVTKNGYKSLVKTCKVK